MVRKAATTALLAAAAALAGAAAHAEDPVQTDPDKYRVLFENDRVRVLDYTDKPGDITRQHVHPAFVLYALTPFKRRITLPDGRALVRDFDGGEVLWSEAQTHVGENIGDTPTHAVIVELK